MRSAVCRRSGAGPSRFRENDGRSTGTGVFRVSGVTVWVRGGSSPSSRDLKMSSLAVMDGLATFASSVCGGDSSAVGGF